MIDMKAAEAAMDLSDIALRMEGLAAVLMKLHDARNRDDEDDPIYPALRYLGGELDSYADRLHKTMNRILGRPEDAE